MLKGLRFAAFVGAAITMLSVGAQGQGCGSSHPYVGFQGNFVTRQHQVSGALTVLDDCSFRIDMWSFDGFAPAAFWWGTTDTSGSRTSFRNGLRVADGMPPRGNGRATIQSVTFLPGVTWDDVSVIYLWCELFDVNFGEVELGPGPPRPVVPATPPYAPGQAAVVTEPATMDVENCEMSFSNCVELIEGRFRVYWEIDDADRSITMMYEGALPSDGLGYMAFGFARADLPEDDPESMIGADAVIAGLLPEEGGFAFDYHLSSKSQCNYATGQTEGVCPDAGRANDPSANNVQFVCASRKDMMTRVIFKRPLDEGDAFDNPWATDGTAKRAVFATGPLQGTSTAELPIVLYHNPLPDGRSSRSPSDFAINLRPSSPSFSCLAQEAQQEMCDMLPQMDTPEPAAVAVISGTGAFDVTTGINLNYPNPPAWGLSYHLNGEESPVIIFEPGTTMSFRIMGGETHPFYITDDINGGASNPDEVIYAGGEDSHGTPEAPFLLQWTPDDSTPDVLYYQCFVHQKLGWKLLKAGSEAAMQALAESGAPADGNPDCAGAPVTVLGRSFTCMIAKPASNGGMLYWMHDEAANTATFATRQPAGGNYVALAFSQPTTPNAMLGSSAVIAQPNSDGSADIQGFTLTAYAPQGVVPDSSLTAAIVESEYGREGGDGILLFTIDLAAAPMPIDVQGATSLIWAHGSSPAVSFHAARGNGIKITLSEGVRAAPRCSSGADASEGSAPVPHQYAHGIMMAVAWALLLPGGVVAARGIPAFGKVAFVIHVVMQVLGILLTVVALAYIIIEQQLPKNWVTQGIGTNARWDHGRVGVAVLAIALLQPLNGIIRPHPGTTAWRRTWEMIHLVIGKAALILGAFNVIFGIYIYTVVNGAEDYAPWIGLCVFSLAIINIVQGVMDKHYHQSTALGAQKKNASAKALKTGNGGSQAVTTMAV